MGISKRLKTIAEQVTPGLRAADIGTDHGYVPIYLVRNDICPYVIAADLSNGSLEKAKDNIRRAGLADKIECRLSDGLDNILPGEADCIIISGVGGILMRRILSDGMETVRSAKELILSPHRDTDLVKAFAEEADFIVEETGLTDKNRNYTILCCRRGV